jgi:GT2 family glycosyltransferase
MSRPAVSVVMPFAGDAAAAKAALDALGSLDAGPGDELILADNAGAASARAGIVVVDATGERSPAHARNAGAAAAHNDWILFIDADCTVPPDLLDAYFARPVAPSAGALAGEVQPDEGSTLAARYGAARGFLGQRAHLAHPFLPRAVAANLLVRREAFVALGGFYEGVRAAEDTDFSWRLQRAGWTLELRPEASVRHRYRASVRELRRQWRGYAAGRAWLARRYDGFTPEPGLRRAAARASRRLRRRSVNGAPTAAVRLEPDAHGGTAAEVGALERARYLGLDVVLGLEELRGLLQSNRPADGAAPAPARVVVIAERFPVAGDPLVDLTRALDAARVEAAARPERIGPDAAGVLEIDYREDDGAAARGRAVALLIARHPWRAGRDLLGRPPAAPPLRALAPAAIRLEHDPDARLHALGGESLPTARRLAQLTGRPLHDPER